MYVVQPYRLGGGIKDISGLRLHNNIPTILRMLECYNAGWVKGLLQTWDGNWGGYIWAMQNTVNFKTSATNTWVSTEGVTNSISRVLVGTIGDYGPMENKTDTGPTLEGLTNNPPSGGSSDNMIYTADFTAYYELANLPLVYIQPLLTNVCINSGNVTFTLGGASRVTNGVTWSLTPEGLTNGATLTGYASNAVVNVGGVATTYVVRATANENTNIYGEAVLNVRKVDIVESNVYLAVGGTTSLHLSADSSANTRWEIMPSVQNGAFIQGSSVGTSIVFNSVSIPTNYTVKAYAEDLTNCYDTCTVTVIKMDLNWEAINSALDDNTNWNGGKRIFPDRQSFTNTTARDKVRLRAKLTPALPNIPLYFKAFDVDDPTPASIDTNGVIDTTGQKGEDNHGSQKAGTLSATSGATDVNGEVLIEFTVTKQPGDNFRAAVALSAAELSKLTVTDTNSASYVGPDNSLPGNFFGGISQMLTVWRRLWIEFDSLETWPSTGDEKNFQTGIITGIQSNMPAAGQSTLQLDILLLDEENRYQGGYIQIAGVGQFTVLYNNYDLQLLVQTVVIQGIPTQTVVGQTFTIYDDDNVEIHLDPPRLMPYPLSGGSLINTAFADAYIKPEPVPATYIDNDVPFNRNMVYGGLDYYFDWLPTVSHGRDLSESEDFWYAYVLAAFQPEVSKDLDPDSSGVVTLGLTDIGLSRSAIYVETIREVEIDLRYPQIKEAYTIVHEIGHQGGVVGHNHDGIMREGSPTDKDWFAPENIKKFRDKPIF